MRAIGREDRQALALNGPSSLDLLWNLMFNKILIILHHLTWKIYLVAKLTFPIVDIIYRNINCRTPCSNNMLEAINKKKCTIFESIKCHALYIKEKSKSRKSCLWDAYVVYLLDSEQTKIALVTMATKRQQKPIKQPAL